MLAKVGHALSCRPRRTDVECELNGSLMSFSTSLFFTD